MPPPLIGGSFSLITDFETTFPSRQNFRNALCLLTPDSLGCHRDLTQEPENIRNLCVKGTLWVRGIKFIASGTSSPLHFTQPLPRQAPPSIPTQSPSPSTSSSLHDHSPASYRHPLFLDNGHNPLRVLPASIGAPFCPLSTDEPGCSMQMQTKSCHCRQVASQPRENHPGPSSGKGLPHLATAPFLFSLFL